jgi:hypothetical protein
VIDGEIIQQTMTAIQVKTYKGEILTIQKDDIRKIDYKFDIRKIEEERRKQEEQRKLEEERRKQEEQRRLEEERRKLEEEQRRLEEERQKQEEQRRIEEERRKQEELLKNKYPFIKDNKNYLDLSLDKFNIKQSVLSSSYYNVAPMEMFLPLIFENLNTRGPKSLPLTIINPWNYNILRLFNMTLGGSKNNFLWEVEIPLPGYTHSDISFSHLNYWEGIFFSYVDSKLYVPLFSDFNSFTPKFLLGYRIRTTPLDSWNVYLGWENYNISYNNKWEINIFYKSLLSNQSLLMLNSKETSFTEDSKNWVDSGSSMSFQGNGPLLVMEYERMFQDIYFRLRLGISQLKGYSDIDYYHNLYYSYDINNPIYYNLNNIINQIDIEFYENHINSQYNLKGYFYNLHLGKMFSSMHEVYFEYTYKNSSVSSSSIKDHKVMEISNSLYLFYFNGFGVSNTGQLPMNNIQFLFYLSLFHQIGGIPQIGDIPIKKNFEDLSIIRIGIRVWF